jgi:hypothetical protein
MDYSLRAYFRLAMDRFVWLLSYSRTYLDPIHRKVSKNNLDHCWNHILPMDSCVRLPKLLPKPIPHRKAIAIQPKSQTQYIPDMTLLPLDDYQPSREEVLLA